MSAILMEGDLQRIYEQIRMLYSLLTPEQKQRFIQLQKENLNV